MGGGGLPTLMKCVALRGDRRNGSDAAIEAVHGFDSGSEHVGEGLGSRPDIRLWAAGDGVCLVGLGVPGFWVLRFGVFLARIG